MTDDERRVFGDELHLCWPNTDVNLALRALEWCEPYGLPVVQQAMMELRKAMPAHHKMVDPNRLLAICKRLADGSRPTAERLAAERESAALAEQERAKTFTGGLAPEIDAQAEAECRKRYDATWPFFAPEAREKLKKAWAKGGFPK